MAMQNEIIKSIEFVSLSGSNFLDMKATRNFMTSSLFLIKSFSHLKVQSKDAKVAFLLPLGVLTEYLELSTTIFKKFER